MRNGARAAPTEADNGAVSPIHVALVAFLVQQGLLAVLWLVVRRRMSRRPALQWALSAMTVSVGMTLVALRAQLNPWVGMVLANAMVFAAVMLILRGIWLFTGQPLRSTLHWAVVAGNAVVLSLLLPAGEIRLMLIWASTTSSVIMVLGALGVQRGLVQEFGVVAARWASVPLWLIAILFLVRSISLALPGSPLAQPLNTNTTGNSVMVLVMMAAGLITHITLLSLVTLRMTRRLEYASHHDALTGLMNRRRINQRLSEEFVRAARYPQTPGLLAIDLDRFKDVNDRYGHPGGDAVLVAVADVLRAAGRESDATARVGGEEFWVLLPDTTPAGAEQAAERILEAVRALRLPAIDAQLRVSVGVAVSAPGETAESLTHRADAALYRAKEAGRDRALTAQAPASSALTSAASLSSPLP